MAPGTPDADREVMANPEVRARFLAALRESAARGADGLARLNYALAWGFDVADVRVPVHIWHGRQDRIVPIEVAELLARRIEGAKLHAFEGEGHSVDYLHIDEILTTLAAAVDGR
jgi:pimeloyl-ACP methyl ester carboxylesterase